MDSELIGTSNTGAIEQRIKVKVVAPGFTVSNQKAVKSGILLYCRCKCRSPGREPTNRIICVINGAEITRTEE